MKLAKIYSAALACAVIVMPVSLKAQSALPGGYTCSDLRTKVASYGATLVMMIARSRGISDNEIVRIRRRCQI